MPPPAQVVYKHIAEPKGGENGYLGFTPGKEEIHKAGSRPGNAKPLSSDILVQHDVEIVVRDGARLYIRMSLRRHTSRDDFTVLILLRKLDKNGKTLYHLSFPIEATPVKSIDEIPEKEMASLNLFSGATGTIRAFHREIDESKSIHPQFPFHPHTRQQKISSNEIVKLEIGIWTIGVHNDAGESISIRIGGQYPSIAEFTSSSGPRPEHELNRGEHIIPSGPEYSSRIILPFIDVKI
ncbi:alpha/beta-hydrolase [Aureobasidium subglaciale]|nr:alpha/beta-hydrolase [Aureobasidium subglaciale]